MSELSLRRAVADDAERVFNWANDPATRAASFSSAVIPWSDHAPWFASSIDRPDRHLFIAMMPTDGVPTPVALVRLQVDANDSTHAEVGVNVAPEARGRGVGRKALVALADAARTLGLQQLLASIRPTNPASVRAFKAVGYNAIADAEIGGQPALRFTLDL